MSAAWRNNDPAQFPTNVLHINCLSCERLTTQYLLVEVVVKQYNTGCTDIKADITGMHCAACLSELSQCKYYPITSLVIAYWLCGSSLGVRGFDSWHFETFESMFYHFEKWSNADHLNNRPWRTQIFFPRKTLSTLFKPQLFSFLYFPSKPILLFLSVQENRFSDESDES